MHIIDEVLVPLTPLANTKTEITNPDAFQFLQQSDLLDIGEENRLRFVYTYKDMFPLGDNIITTLVEYFHRWATIELII